MNHLVISKTKTDKGYIKRLVQDELTETEAKRLEDLLNFQNDNPNKSYLAICDTDEVAYEDNLSDRMKIIDFENIDRPGGYQIFTHDEAKKLLNELEEEF